MKIGVLGIGAIGSVIVSYLRPSVSLYCFNRSKKEVIRIWRFGNDVVIPVDCTNSTNSTNPQILDWLIICLKEYQFIEAKHWFENLITQKTKVVVIRNGLGFKESLLPFTLSENILECIIDCSTQLLENGYYHQLSKPILTVLKSELSNKFTEIFNTNEIIINQVQDFKTESWKKVCQSSTLGFNIMLVR